MKQQPTATRRLVKSPPELWAELSSEDSLGRHLAEFGEIRITRVDPETTVAWEGDRASGTVELTPTGWGTKVMLTATPVQAPAVPEPAVAEVQPAPEPDPEQPVAEIAEPPAAEIAEPPVAEIAEPSAAEIAEPPPPEALRTPPPEPRQGFFARLFRKRPAESAAPTSAAGPAASIPGPPAPTPDPSPPTPAPAPGPIPPPAPDPVPPTPAPQPPPPPQIEILDPDRTVAILTEVLDDLGAAHHRPFSRD